MEGMNILNEEELIKYPTSYKLGTAMNWALLTVHFILLLVFGIWGAWAMVFVNVISVIVYIKLFPMIKKKPGLYIIITIVEVLVHMFFACFFVGWDCGFGVYSFGVVPVAFFTDYAVRKDGARGFHTIAVSIASALCYLLCRVMSFVSEPVYDIDGVAVKSVSTINGILVLAIITVFSYIYVNSILENESDLMDVAEYDALTGLANRHRINRTIPLYGIDMDASKEKYATAILDIDNFKKVNDNFGHLAGDQVLKDIARILRDYEASDVFVFRWGGEEFMLIVVGDDPYGHLMEICEQVRCDVAGNVSIFDYYRIVVTISSGVAESEVGESFKDLTDRADKCLYKAKGNGKNQVVGAKSL